MKGKKFDGEKLSWVHFLWPEAEKVMEVLQYGSKKYDWNNFEKVEGGMDRYTSALYRHLIAISREEVYDRESGLEHMAHIACNALILLRLQHNKNYKLIVERMSK